MAHKPRESLSAVREARVTALDADVSIVGICTWLDESHSNSHSCRPEPYFSKCCANTKQNPHPKAQANKDWARQGKEVREGTQEKEVIISPPLCT